MRMQGYVVDVVDDTEECVSKSRIFSTQDEAFTYGSTITEGEVSYMFCSSHGEARMVDPDA